MRRRVKTYDLTCLGMRPLVNDDDKRANNKALIEGTRLRSAYLLKSRIKIWIIKVADRAATTVLLPDEY